MRQSLKRTASPNFIDRLRRTLWGTVAITMFRPTPIRAFVWRQFLLRAFGARISGHVYVYPDAHIWAPWNLTMEDGSCLGSGVWCYNVGQVALRMGALVSQRAHLCAATHDYDSSVFELVIGDIIIEPDAWVAAEAFVGPGVTLGEGAVALARAVVVRDVPPWSVVGGNPARQVRVRKRLT